MENRDKSYKRYRHIHNQNVEMLYEANHSIVKHVKHNLTKWKV